MRVLMITQRVDADHDVLGFTVDWIATLAAQDAVERLDVLTAYEGRHELPSNVHIRSFGKERGLPKWRRVLEFERHCLNYARAGIDVVFVHMIPRYVLASWPWLRPTGTRFVLWYAHSSVTWDLRLAVGLVDRILTPSVDSFRMDTTKVRIAGHGIDTDRFVSPEPDRRNRDRLLGVGRIDPVKNFDILVRAVKKLENRAHDISLRVVGDSSDESDTLEELRSLSWKLGIDNSVTWVGVVPHHEIVAEYQRAGVYVNASLTGSLDKTEVEAMACGTPVVSCNDSYVSMVRQSELDSQLLTFDAGDVEALADRLSEILSLDHEAYENLSAQSRTVARKHHDLTAQMQRITADLRDVIK